MSTRWVEILLWLLLLLLISSPHGARAATPEIQVEGDADDEVVEAPDTEIHGSLILASDYIARGTSQTAHEPALQGLLQWHHTSGIGLEVFASNVYYPGSAATLELDPGIYYSGQVWRYLSIKIGSSYHTYYPGEDRSYFGFPLALLWKEFAFEVDYTPRWNDQSNHSYYYVASWTDTLFWDLTCGAAVGYATYSQTQLTPDRPDYRVSVSHPFLGLDWEVAATYTKPQTLLIAAGGQQPEEGSAGAEQQPQSLAQKPHDLISQGESTTPAASGLEASEGGARLIFSVSKSF